MSSVSSFAPAFTFRQSLRRTQQYSRKRAKKRSSQSDLTSSTADDGDVDRRPSAPQYDLESDHDSRPLAHKDIAETNTSKVLLSGAQGDSISSDEDGSDDEDSVLRSSSSQRRQAQGPMRRGLSDHVGLRKQHLAVVIAILHKSLSAGDYVRAGRAWGMLLRAEAEGRYLDVRKHGRWGIGAEILLFHETHLMRKRTEPEEAEGLDKYYPAIRDNFGTYRQPPTLFSQAGFSKAKEYYERLILQYPYRKTMPYATSSLQFYPAMFGLWIYAVQNNHQRILTTLRQGDDSRSADHESVDSKRIRAMTLQSTSEIASRLDELLVSPPYSDQADLWRVRGMVALWTADLLSEGFDRDPAYEQDRAMLDSDSVVDQSDFEQAETEQKNSRKRELDAKSKAQEAFYNVSKILTLRTKTEPNDVDV